MNTREALHDSMYFLGNYGDPARCTTWERDKAAVLAADPEVADFLAADRVRNALKEAALSKLQTKIDELED